MSAATIYHKIRAHLLTQNAVSLADEGCAYRAPGGLQCAGGACIPDDMYKPEFEGKTWDQLRAAAPDIDTLYNEAEHRVIRAAQNIHDNYEKANWRYELDLLAKVKGFKV